MLRLSPWRGVGVDVIRGKGRGPGPRAVVRVSYEQGQNTLGTTRKTTTLPAQGNGSDFRTDKLHAHVEQRNSIYS